MSSTGNCLVFHGNQVEDKKPILSVESFRLPSTIDEIQDGEILVKILVATVCGSDLHTITAKRSEPTPSVLGHEGCGEVILSRRSDISIGQIVTFAICHFCQDCINCKENSLEQKCKKLFKYGHSLFAGPSDVPSGCYSTHILLKSGTAVVTIPPEVPLDLAATANCALATVANVVDLAETFKGAYGRLKKHRSILILGGGLLCLFGIAMLRELGYYDIDCAEMDLKRGETISIFGANFIQAQQLRNVKKTYDLIIEVCGVKEALVETCTSNLAEGALIIIVGLCHQDSDLKGITADLLIRKCATIIGVHNYRGKHLKEAVDFLQKNYFKLSIGELFSPTLGNLQKLKETFIEDPGFFRKYHRVIVSPN